MTLREGLLAQILRPGSRNQEGYGLALTTNLVPEHWTELLDSLIFHYPPCDMGTGMSTQSWCEHKIKIVNTKRLQTIKALNGDDYSCSAEAYIPFQGCLVTRREGFKCVSLPSAFWDVCRIQKL